MLILERFLLVGINFVDFGENRPYAQLLLFDFFIGLGLSACKQQVYLTVTEPPAVHLIKEYTRGGIINRTFSEGGSKVIDDIDNALTLEGDIDRTGSNAAVRGL